MNTYGRPVLPYVYRLDHPVTGEFYIGLRYGNKVSAEKDLGVKYFTSSKTVKPRFNEFSISIVAEFFNKDDAFIFEQSLIRENWNSELIMNNAIQNKNGIELKFYTSGKTGKSCAVDVSTGINLGMIDVSDPRWETGEIIHFNKGKKKPVGFSEKLRKANIGKHHSQETRDKLREIATGVIQKRETIEKRMYNMKNKVWINNKENNKRVLSKDLDGYLMNGWFKGRIGKTNQYD